jgi:hypothetical protein
MSGYQELRDMGAVFRPFDGPWGDDVPDYFVFCAAFAKAFQ